ncbi:hypothetical protein Lal_00025474 [Lupinus albus]|nr:hypothetical protein Lal_00025474 [Lupinus albus]
MTTSSSSHKSIVAVTTAYTLPIKLNSRNQHLAQTNSSSPQSRHPIDDIDLFIVALNGLGPLLREFSASILTRDTPLMSDELSDKLIDFEIFLNLDDTLQQYFLITTNYTQHTTSGHTNGHHSQSIVSNFHSQATLRPQLENASQQCPY